MENFPRERQRKWDDQHLKTISTHLPLVEWQALKIICRRQRISRYWLLQDFLRRYIRRHVDLLRPPQMGY